MRYIFGSDFDGTYCRYSGKVSDRELEAVRAFRKKGNLFGIVSGRNVYETWDAVVPNLCGEYDFIVCSEGAVCLIPDGTTLFGHYASGKYLPELYDTALSEGAFFFHFDSAGYESADELPKQLLIGEDSTGDIPDIPGMNVMILHHTVDRSLRCPVDPAHLGEVRAFSECCILFRDMADTHRVRDLLIRRFEGKLEFTTNHNVLAVTAAGVNKASGLAKYASLMGVPAENVCAAGDSLNDFGMLSAFRGFVMDNSSFPEMLDGRFEIVSDVAQALSKL